MAQGMTGRRSLSVNDVQESMACDASRRQSAWDTSTAMGPMFPGTQQYAQFAGRAQSYTLGNGNPTCCSEASDVSPTSGATSRGFYSAAEQVNTSTGRAGNVCLGRNSSVHRPLKRSRSNPSSVLQTPASSEPQDVDNDDYDSEDPDNKKRSKKPHLQGRFSGRLETKEDEKKLAAECKLLGPLLGGVGKRGERCRLTLAKIVRGIASGEVRSYLERREQEIQALQDELDMARGSRHSQLEHMQAELENLKHELAKRDQQIQHLSGVRIVHQAQLAAKHVSKHYPLASAMQSSGMPPMTCRPPLHPGPPAAAVSTSSSLQNGAPPPVMPAQPDNAGQALLPYVLQATPVAGNGQLLSNAATSSAGIVPAALLHTAPEPAAVQLATVNSSSGPAGGIQPVCSSVSGHQLTCPGPSRASSVTSPGIPAPRANTVVSSAGLVPAMAPGLPVAAAPSGSVVQGPSEVEKLEAGAQAMTAQAAMLQEQAQKCMGFSQITPSGDLAQQAHVQAESFQYKAASLDKAAEAQLLQAKAVQHQHAEEEARQRATSCIMEANYRTSYAANRLEEESTALTQAAICASADPRDAQLLPPVEALKQEVENVEIKAADDAFIHNDLMEQATVAIQQAHDHQLQKKVARFHAAIAAQESHKLDATAQQLQINAHQLQPSDPFQNGPGGGLMIPAEQVAAGVHSLPPTGVIAYQAGPAIGHDGLHAVQQAIGDEVAQVIGGAPALPTHMPAMPPHVPAIANHLPAMPNGMAGLPSHGTLPMVQQNRVQELPVQTNLDMGLGLPHMFAGAAPQEHLDAMYPVESVLGNDRYAILDAEGMQPIVSLPHNIGLPGHGPPSAHY